MSTNKSSLFIISFFLFYSFPTSSHAEERPDSGSAVIDEHENGQKKAEPEESMPENNEEKEVITEEKEVKKKKTEQVDKSAYSPDPEDEYHHPDSFSPPPCGCGEMEDHPCDCDSHHHYDCSHHFHSSPQYYAWPGHTVVSRYGYQLNFEGYLRTSGSYIFYDEKESDFIGRNPGFGLANVRFGVFGLRDNTFFAISADGSVAVMDGSNTSRGTVTMRLADALIGHTLIPGYLDVVLGQQKVPFDGETLISTSSIPFIYRSVWQRGVRGTEGFNVEGLGIDREAGLGFSGRYIRLANDSVLLSYYAALTNGSPPSQPLNENKSFAAYARLELDLFRFINIGAAAYHNTRTFGSLPDLLDERHLGFAGDLSAEYAGLWLRLDYIQRMVEYPDVEAEPARTSLGFSASAGYRISNFYTVAYRLAFYDPAWDYSGADSALATQLDSWELTYHTFGISWDPVYKPVSLQLNYTMARENPDREVQNDRIDLLGRLVF